MNILDIIILLCFIAAIFQGIRKGIIAQVVAIVSIIAGIALSVKFSGAAANWLGGYIQTSANILRITAFAIILVIVIFGFWGIGKAIEATVKIVMLGWLNKLLGAVFSLLKCVLILGLVILAFDAINNSFHFINDQTISSSVLYSSIKEVSTIIFPEIKKLLTIR